MNLVNLNTENNLAVLKALQLVKETQWVGNTTHNTLDKCLTAINLYCGMNSGFYKPTATRLPKLSGIFMVNENGDIFAESRIIKKSENGYLIEYMSSEAQRQYDKNYESFL